MISYYKIKQIIRSSHIGKMDEAYSLVKKFINDNK